jgi:hypothetical protein
MLRIAIGLALVSYGLIGARQALNKIMLVGAGLATIFSGIYV